MEVFKHMSISSSPPGNSELTVHRTKTSEGFEALSIKRAKKGIGDSPDIIYTTFELKVEEVPGLIKLLQEIVDYKMEI